MVAFDVSAAYWLSRGWVFMVTVLFQLRSAWSNWYISTGSTPTMWVWHLSNSESGDEKNPAFFRSNGNQGVDPISERKVGCSCLLVILLYFIHSSFTFCFVEASREESCVQWPPSFVAKAKTATQRPPALGQNFRGEFRYPRPDLWSPWAYGWHMALCLLLSCAYCCCRWRCQFVVGWLDSSTAWNALRYNVYI